MRKPNRKTYFFGGVSGFKFRARVRTAVNVKAVVFDLDGTLASFNLDYKLVRVEVRSHLMKRGLPASILSTSDSIFEMLKKAEISLRNEGKPEEAIVKLRKEALLIAEEHELEAASSASLLPGVPEGLGMLKNMGLRIGLFTINSEKSTSIILKRFRIAKFFDSVVSRDRVECVKPDSEHLGVALEALEAKPDEAVVVGDGVSDMKCAHDLKATAVGLPTGVSSREKLINSGADYVITSIADLPALIQRVNSGK